MSNIGYLRLLYSGGAANADPDAALGGIISATAATSQSVSAPVNVTGVAIVDSVGNLEGADGELVFNAAATTLRWSGPSDGYGSVIDVSAGGLFQISSASTGYLLVNVTPASLPGSDQSDSGLTVTNLWNTLFDDVSKAESNAGDVECRCLYVKNTHATETAFDLKIFLQTDAFGADSIALGLDPAGNGDGATTGVATTIASEGEVPAGVTWSAPSSYTVGLDVGDLAPGQARACWIRRTVPVDNQVPTPADYCVIGLGAKY